jgi:HD-GYP domain-containing protein (c-di-GMP phosphodiesterase class II)
MRGWHASRHMVRERLMVRLYDNRLANINESLAVKVAERSDALLRSRDAVIFGLAKLAESRDDQTGAHLDRICRYAEILARQIANGDGKLDERWVYTVRETAVLHDVGKVGIPDSVLLKPGPLTEPERAIMQKHPYIGGDTLMAIRRRWGEDPFLVTATQIVFGHHEKWDGSGYPFGLKGENIPLTARIVAVADVYDALTSERTYTLAFTHETARQILTEGSGQHFDPRIVAAFQEVEAEFRTIAERPRRSRGNGDDESGSTRTKPEEL